MESLKVYLLAALWVHSWADMRVVSSAAQKGSKWVARKEDSKGA